jgi:hypothetical protein
MATDTVNRLHDALASKDFTDILDKATAEQISVENKSKDNLADLECQFVDNMLPSNPKVQNILGNFKSSTDDEKAMAKEWTKTQRRRFKAVTKLLSSGSSGKDPIQGMVDKIADVAMLLKYLGDTRLEEAFEKAGMKLEVTPLEEAEPYFADNEDAKTTIADIFTQAKESTEEVAKVNAKIDTEYFEETDSSLKYDKETNASGIKKSDFRKLMKIRRVAMENNSQKYTAFKQKTVADRQASLDKEQAILSRIEEM